MPGTHHGISKLEKLSCPRAYYYEHVLGLEQPPSLAVVLGSAWHALLASRYHAHVALPLAEAINAGLTCPELAASPQFYDQVATELRRIAPAYWERFGTSATDEEFDVLRVEVEHEMQIRTAPEATEAGESEEESEEETFTVPLTGRLDAIVRDCSTGRLFVLEHKTAGWLRPAVFLVAHQLTGYTLLAEDLMQEPCAGVLMNVAIKTKVPSFYRELYLRSPAQQADFARQLTWMYTQIQYASATGEWVCHPNACHQYGACSYAELCMQPQEDPTMLWKEVK